MPQAWLIRTIDTDDSTEPSPWPVPTCSSPTCARGDSGHIAAADAHVAMRFEPVLGAVHTFYDGQTLTGAESMQKAETTEVVHASLTHSLRQR